MKKVLICLAALAMAGIICVAGFFFFYTGNVNGSDELGEPIAFNVEQGELPNSVAVRLAKEGMKETNTEILTMIFLQAMLKMSFVR